jgi:hypothetical protein
MQTRSRANGLMPMTEDPDWKHIAIQMGRRVNFAGGHLHSRGSGDLCDENLQEIIHWRDFMADALELIPGLTVDREAMHALDLPQRERRKFFKDRAAQQATQEASDS